MKHHEIGGYSATLTTELRRGESSRVSVAPNQTRERGPRIAADIVYGGQDGRVAENAESAGQRLLIVDVRDAERHTNGAILYDGQLLDPSTAFLAIDPAQLDWKEHRGYKGIRAGEVVTFGRGQYEDRFPIALDTTSREHLALAFNPEKDELEFADLSSNGTTIRSGHINHELPFQRHEINDTIPSSWDEKYVAPEESNEFGARTLADQAKILDAEHVARSAQEWRTDRRQPPITHEILAAQGLEPILGIAVKDREFMFSGLIADEHGREYSVGYTRDEQQRVIPRMFYKSNSDGGWRVSPYIHDDGVFSKGELPHLRYADGLPAQYGQYAQATKPDESIVALLEEMERKQIRAHAPRYSAELMKESLRESRYEQSGIHDTFEQQVDITCVGGYGLDAYSSGTGFRYDSDMSRGMIEAMKLPPGFQPDFSQKALRSYLTEHTILGKTHVEVYRGVFEGGVIEWHVAHAQESDTVWLDRISMPDSDVTQYGTRKQLILAGALSAKPVDYRSQARGMVPGVDTVDVTGRGNSSYVSIKPLLDKMPWVKQYRQAQLAAVSHRVAELPRQQQSEEPAAFIDHIPDEIRFAAVRADQQAALAKEQQRIAAEKKTLDRLEAMYAFPAPQGRDRFGNSRDERRRVTPESTEAAAMAYRFVDDHIKQLIKSAAGDKWREDEMQGVVRENDALRTAIGTYLMDKIKDASMRLPERLIRDQQKRPSTAGYDTPNMTGREYATLLALSMLDGTFKPSRTGDAIEVSKYGNVLQGQHRYAALKLLGLDTSPYTGYLNMKRGQ